MIRLEDIVVEPPGIGQVLDVVGLFDPAGPVEMEIGCGKGGFLLRQARAHPERNYFGVEWANEIYRYAADRFRRWGLTNVRLMRADARHLMIHQFPVDVLSALHVYHPDPWPKRRHHKRRLFTPPFVEAAVRALRPGARWAVQSDHAEYFDVVRGLLRDHPMLEPIDFDDAEFGTVDERTETNYEVKYLREGRPIYRLAVRKKGS
jgi:tRNA (guanine-N7-)-methyltransferase